MCENCGCNKKEKVEEKWFKQMFEKLTKTPITKSTIIVDNCDCGCDDECVDDCNCKK